MRRRRPDAGQATVELALVLPVVVLLVLAVLQVGLVARGEVMTVHAAREAARTVAVGEPDGAARPAALASGPFPAHQVRVSVRRQSDSVRVEVRYRQPTDVPLVGALLGDVEHVAAATMRLET